MKVLYNREVNINKLHDELIAAGIHPSYIGGDYFEVADDTDANLIDSIMAIHDPTPNVSVQPTPEERLKMLEDAMDFIVMNGGRV